MYFFFLCGGIDHSGTFFTKPKGAKRAIGLYPGLLNPLNNKKLLANTMFKCYLVLKCFGILMPFEYQTKTSIC